MIIAISGTPGVGKSEVAKLVGKKLGYKVVEINRLLNIPYGREKEVSVRDMNKKLSVALEDNTIIVSHLSHFLKDHRIKTFFVLRCSPLVLAERLKKRNYSRKKACDNVMFEAIDGEFLEASRLHKNIIQLDNTKDIDKTVESIVSFVKERAQSKS